MLLCNKVLDEPGDRSGWVNTRDCGNIVTAFIGCVLFVDKNGASDDISSNDTGMLLDERFAALARYYIDVSAIRLFNILARNSATVSQRERDLSQVVPNLIIFNLIDLSKVVSFVHLSGVLYYVLVVISNLVQGQTNSPVLSNCKLVALLGRISGKVTFCGIINNLVVAIKSGNVHLS